MITSMKQVRLRTRSTKPPRRGAPKTFRVQGRRGLHDLLEIYQGLSGFNASTLGLTEHKTTYGEVAEAGMKILSEKFTAHAPIMNFPEDQRTFYDLGCGIGRLNLGMAILHPEIQSRGIEIVPDRVRQAHHAIERLSKAKQITHRIQITQGSFLDPSANYGNACWIFLSNLCFDEKIQGEIYTKLDASCKKGCIIICSREFALPTPSRFEKIELGVNVPMTWSNTSTCVVYRVL
jgi:hypothetical protein